MPKDKIIEQGYIFQSDTMSDDDFIALMDKCRDTWFEGYFVHGSLVLPGIIGGIFGWMDNPKLENYPLLENSNLYMQMVMDAPSLA